MPILEPLSFECTSHSEEQTQRLGMRLGALLQPGAVLALYGEIGAGKTSFARGVGLGWGADQILRSPTFTLVQKHHRAQDSAALYHVDLYRATNEEDLRTLGLEEIIEDPLGVVVIEWPERVQHLLPEHTIHVRLRTVDEYRRHLTFATQNTQAWQTLLAFRKATFGV
ncbi:MAG: tRNA (adenosine(37)-N6)-threonylcarbamoyltransferase complex ATPase subunit type 1 TsaE [Thermoflexales bacterium]